MFSMFCFQLNVQCYVCTFIRCGILHICIRVNAILILCSVLFYVCCTQYNVYILNNNNERLTKVYREQFQIRAIHSILWCDDGVFSSSVFNSSRYLNGVKYIVHS